MPIRLHIPDVREERGIAMITAMLVTFVVFLLSAVVIQQAIHNINGSAKDRNRLSAVSAAEAGLDWAYSKIEGTDSTALWNASQTGTVG
jgi:Tfp pilus assembly protein PilX